MERWGWFWRRQATANLGNYVFNFTLFEVDLDTPGKPARVVAPLGPYMLVTPMLSAGYLAARVGLGMMYTILATPAGDDVLLVINLNSGKVT